MQKYPQEVLLIMAGKKGMKHYKLETKLLAVQMYLEQGYTQRQIARILDLPRKELIEQWVYRYRREGEQGFHKPIGRPRKSPLSQEGYIARLEMENALLKKYHTELRKVMLAKRDIGPLNTTEETIQ
jgi:transposase-like protein